MGASDIGGPGTAAAGASGAGAAGTGVSGMGADGAGAGTGVAAMGGAGASGAGNATGSATGSAGGKPPLLVTGVELGAGTGKAGGTNSADNRAPSSLMLSTAACPAGSSDAALAARADEIASHTLLKKSQTILPPTPFAGCVRKEV